MRVCSTPGCGTLVATQGPCAAHRSEARRRRGDPPDRHAHRVKRTQLLRTAVGRTCPICHLPMLPGQPLDLDHTLPRALGGVGAGDRITHAACNRSLGGQLSARLRRDRRG